MLCFLLEGPQRYTIVRILDGYPEVSAHAFDQIKIGHKSDSLEKHIFLNATVTYSKLPSNIYTMRHTCLLLALGGPLRARAMKSTLSLHKMCAFSSYIISLKGN